MTDIPDSTTEEMKEPPVMVVVPLGVVMQKRRIGHRWQEWLWEPVAVVEGVGDQAEWKEMIVSKDLVRYFAGSLNLELHRADAEAYFTNLGAESPVIYVILRAVDDGDLNLDAARFGVEFVPFHITASPYEAQDYVDSGEEIVERVAMPEGLLERLRGFVEIHYREEVFYKRQRDRVKIDQRENGRGDPRIRQMGDVYRSPGGRRGKDK